MTGTPGHKRRGTGRPRRTGVATLKRLGPDARSVSRTVTVEVVGEETTAVAVDDGATYADLSRAVGYNPHEVAVLVDEKPVPDDAPVEADRATVLRLVKGGCGAARGEDDPPRDF